MLWIFGIIFKNISCQTEASLGKCYLPLSAYDWSKKYKQSLGTLDMNPSALIYTPFVSMAETDF